MIGVDYRNPLWVFVSIIIVVEYFFITYLIKKGIDVMLPGLAFLMYGVIWGYAVVIDLIYFFMRNKNRDWLFIFRIPIYVFVLIWFSIRLLTVLLYVYDLVVNI